MPLDSCVTLGRSGLAVSPLGLGRGGTTLNGEAYAVWPLSPKTDAERY